MCIRDSFKILFTKKSEIHTARKYSLGDTSDRDWYPEYIENSELENNKTNDPLLFFEQTLHQRKDTDDK